MNRILVIVPLLFFGLMTNVNAETCSSMQKLKIFLGDWESLRETGSTVETWSKVSEGSFEGIGATLDLAGAVQNRETLRLVEMSGEVFYIAKVPQNELPTAFKLTKCGQNFFVFENPLHDFPKKITYSFEGSSKMNVRVSGSLDSDFELNFIHVQP